MTTAARIYLVTANSGDVSLVKAISQSQALRHVSAPMFTVKAASAIEVGDHMTKGTAIEDATKTTDSGEQE